MRDIIIAGGGPAGATLGLGILKSVLVSPQLFAVRTMDIKTGIE